MRRASIALAICLTGCAEQAAKLADCGQPGSPVVIPGGTFTMGTDEGYSEEGPARRVIVESFMIDAAEVTNRRFTEFVKATGYVTLAERGPDPADYPGLPPEALVPGSAVFHVPVRPGVEWWRFQPGASWRTPAGPGSAVPPPDHPVVHVAYEDAVAFAAWAGGRLPSEAEWERAARGGLVGATFEWGEESPGETLARGQARANTYQGVFPVHDSGADGHAGLAPVGCYAPNGYGLHDATGNVWEWTADEAAPGLGLIKGGSYLCAESYCKRYRPAARHPQERDFSASHVGFRVAYDTERTPSEQASDGRTP